MAETEPGDVANGGDADLHCIVHFQKEGAWVPHAPLLVGHIKTRARLDFIAALFNRQRYVRSWSALTLLSLWLAASSEYQQCTPPHALRGKIWKSISTSFFTLIIPPPTVMGLMPKSVCLRTVWVV